MKSKNYFRDEVARLLTSTEIPLRVVAVECDVSQRYVYDLAKGKYADPGVEKTLRVYEYLSGRKVKAA